MLVLSRQQVRRVDQVAIDDFGMPGIVLMENAAAGATDVILRSLPHSRPLILCGGGNNGGDGLAIARHLHNAGCNVTVGLCNDPSKYIGDALINWRIVQKMGLPIFPVTPDWITSFVRESRTDVLIDAIFGTGLSATPREPFPAIVRAVHATKIPVAAIDLPSGLDCDTGRTLGQECIRATVTITFVAMKKGFLEPVATDFVGKIEVVGIGCPIEAIERASRE